MWFMVTFLICRDECKREAFGASSNLFLGYKTHETAEAAFQYALSKGWVRCSGSNRSVKHQQPFMAPTSIPFDPVYLTLPDAYTSPLNEGRLMKKWYVVYKGLAPGIYKS